MVANLALLLTAGALVASGVFLLLERAMTKMLMGLLLMGNGFNLLLLTAGGGAGAPPIQGRNSTLNSNDADPLAQGMILTAIVISMAMTAFILALAYRQYRYRTADLIGNDTEDTAIASRSGTASASPDHGDDNIAVDTFEAPVRPAAGPESPQGGSNA